jgi:SnoaL-like domain
MDARTQHGRRHFLAQGGAAALASIALQGAVTRTTAAQEGPPASGTPVSATPMADCPGQEQVTRNLELMDQLDFEGWNGRDWDLFSQLHGEEVIVAGFGTMTEGNAEHVAWAQAFIEENPTSMIEAHPIRIGAGDWTAVVGTFVGGGSMCTVARWEDGRIAEEYLFSG